MALIRRDRYYILVNSTFYCMTTRFLTVWWCRPPSSQLALESEWRVRQQREKCRNMAALTAIHLPLLWFRWTVLINYILTNTDNVVQRSIATLSILIINSDYQNNLDCVICILINLINKSLKGFFFNIPRSNYNDNPSFIFPTDWFKVENNLEI